MIRKIISIIILLSIFIAIFQTTVFAVNSADIKPPQEDESQQIIISNTITLAKLTFRILGLIVSPILILIGSILDLKNKHNSNYKIGKRMKYIAIILFVIYVIIEIVFRPRGITI